MRGGTLTLRPADEPALSYVEELLERNGLPTRDVRAKPDCFYVASVREDRVGVGGIEEYGSVGLLRSIVVERRSRGQGYGTKLCEALETTARDDGVETLYLLTTTASEFFADRGYEPVERTAVPPALGRTAQFEELCPATATCMKMTL